MSEFNVDDFLEAFHRSPQKKTVRFDKAAFEKALKATRREKMPGLTESGHSVLFVYPGSLDLVRIARGMAVASGRPAQIVELVSDDLLPGDSGVLLRPILHGQLLVLVHSGTSTIPANLAEYWPKFSRNPGGYSAAVDRDLMLGSHLKPDPPGAVIVIQNSHMDRYRSDLDEWQLLETEAAEFATLGDDFNGPVATIGRVEMASELLPDNQQAYRSYRKLISTICESGHDRAIAELVVKRALRGTDASELVADFHYHGIGRELYDQLFHPLRSLARHCRGIKGGFRKGEELPDVYAAALKICAHWEGASQPGTVVYRGQRDHIWDVIPTFFRPNPDGSPPDLAMREQRLARFVHLMKKAYPQLDELQCIAAAQHVSKEAETPTWLVDVTWDPLIALYFASSGGQEGKIGVVDQIVIPEWKKYVASEPDYPGGMISCEVPGIERIRRQRGLFLNAPRADLYERYFPHRIWFRQQDGLVFADALIEPPLTEEFLLPSESGLSKIIAAVEGARSKPKALANRPCNPTEALSPRDLLNTLREREGVSQLDEYHRTVLEIIVELYTDPQKWTADKNSEKFSLHRLDEVILVLVNSQRSGRRCDFESALRYSKTRLTEAEFGALLNLCHHLWTERY